MKGAFAAALSGLQSLGADDWRERPVDRVGAMGAAQIARAEHELEQTLIASLGVDLIRFKFGGVDKAEADAQDKLAAIMGWERWWGGKCPLSARQRDDIATWAVHEWAKDLCPPRPNGCGGAKEVPSAAKPIDGAQPMMVCSECGGTGKRRWKDAERIEAMGEAHEKAMDKAHAIIGGAESLAMRLGMEQIERWPR